MKYKDITLSELQNLPGNVEVEYYLKFFHYWEKYPAAFLQGEFFSVILRDYPPPDTRLRISNIQVYKMQCRLRDLL